MNSQLLSPHSSIVPVCYCMSLNLCLPGWRLSRAFVPMSMFVLVCLSCLSLTKGFVLSFIEQHRMHHARKIPNGGYFKETFNGVDVFFQRDEVTGSN